MRAFDKGHEIDDYGQNSWTYWRQAVDEFRHETLKTRGRYPPKAAFHLDIRDSFIIKFEVSRRLLKRRVDDRVFDYDLAHTAVSQLPAATISGTARL